jgi:chromosome segregation ATPase
MHTDGMENQRRNELLARREELVNKQTGLEGSENRRQDAEDRVVMAAAALNTPGFPKPLPAEVESAERDLREATDECDRINAELRDIDDELGRL